MRPNENSRAYLHGLDGWRAVAVATVLLDHAQPFGSARLQRHLQSHGEQGVWLFFAISGLLICSRMLDEEALYGQISFRDFYIRRAFRILPAAVTYLLVVAILGALGTIPFDGSSWWSALFFYRNYWHYFHGATTASWFTGHFWSLSVEEHFYFILPGVMVFMPRFRRGTLLLLTMLSCGWLGFFLAHSPSGSLHPFWGQRTEFCLCALLIPAVYAVSMRSVSVRERATRLLSPWWICVSVAALSYFDFTLAGEGRYWLQMVAVRAALYPLMLLSTILHPMSWITRVLETGAMKFIGRISYSLYLWQTLFLTRTFSYPGAIHFLQRPIVGVVCTFVCAIVSYYLVERPLIRVGRRFAVGRETSVPIAA